MTNITAPSQAVAWVEQNTGRTLTEAQQRAIDVICRTDSPWNLPLINDGWASATEYKLGTSVNPYDDDADELEPTPAVEFHPSFVVIRMRTTMSTYDCDRLTRLVLASHAKLVRTQISAGMYVAYDPDSYVTERRIDGNGDTGWVETDQHPHSFQPCLEIQLNARQHDGRLYERHPDADDLATLAQQWT